LLATLSRRNISAGFNLLLGVIGIITVAIALFNLRATTQGLVVESISIDGTPATIFRPATTSDAPVVIIAHGFAGSQQLMQAFAVTFARNGYIAVTFDFAGHGRNPQPLTGSIMEEDGATQALAAETARVAAHMRARQDAAATRGVAVLGHSMASDIVVRFAQKDPDVVATIAVSMFSPAVTATTPANLLIIVGAWEGFLREEALRAVTLAFPDAQVREGVTYGDLDQGSARRAAFSPNVEHVGVLYSRASMSEALAWLDASFDITRAGTPYLDSRGLFIILLLAGSVALARPLFAWLPIVTPHRAGASLPWRQLWPCLLLPAIFTPLVLRVVPTHFLPVLVGDYLAAHFAIYGLLTAITLFWIKRRQAISLARTGLAKPAPGALIPATAGFVAFGFVFLVWPVDTYVTSFVPGSWRLPLVLAMLVGTLAFFTSDEWLTRGAGAARGGYFASKIAFLLSLAGAVALDFERLFFLVIIVPVIAIFFVVYGLLSRWAYARTGHPLVGAIGNAIAFAWAIGVTFPLLAG